MSTSNETAKNSNYEGLSYNDFVSNFVVDSTSDCFKTCISDFKTNEISKSEKECLVGCYSKFNYSYIVMSELMHSSVENLESNN